VERIERHDFSFVIYNCQGTRRDQDHFRMADRVFESIRGPHGKRREAASCNPLANPLNVHAEILLIGFDTVNRGGFAPRHADPEFLHGH